MTICQHMASSDDFCEVCDSKAARDASEAFGRLHELFRDIEARVLDTIAENTIWRPKRDR